jgi:hypothetical protein
MRMKSYKNQQDNNLKSRNYDKNSDATSVTTANTHKQKEQKAGKKRIIVTGKYLELALVFGEIFEYSLPTTI